MRKIAVALILSGLVGCQKDESSTGVVQNQLTAGSSKAWKIESATLTNTTTSDLSITSLPNVNDDELVFTSAGSGANGAQLNWKIRNQVRANAATTKEALLDYYLSGLTSSLTIHDNGSITSDDPNLAIELISAEKVTLRYQMGDSELSFNLVPGEQVTFVPSSFDFEFLDEIEGTALGLEQAAGFTGSMASNSLYFSYKAFVTSGNFVNPERVVRYDIDDGSFTTRDFNNTDFVTKELHIINDELKVVGAQFINTYPLDLASDPVSTPHNLMLTRYGSSVVDNNVFLWGGDLHFPPGSPGGAGPDANKIYQHDQVTGQLNEVGELPEPRYWAHGEIMDGKLYVFGGRQAFVPVPDVGEDDIFIHDMQSGENQTLKLPNPMNRTFAARYRGLIYVAGQHYITNPDPALTEIETSFGVFNTRTNTYTVIPCALDFTGQKTVFGLTIVGDKLFILYGKWGDGTFSIYQTSLGAS